MEGGPRAVAYPRRVALQEFGEALKELDTTLGTIEAVLDLDKLRAEIADLSEQAAAPDLWDDQERAQRVTSRLSSQAQNEVARVEGLRSRIDDLGDHARDGRGGVRRRGPGRHRDRARPS